jgi:hypothetical protein
VNEDRLPQRYNSKLLGALSVLLASFCSSAALADEYKQATEQAYCAGVYQADVMLAKRMNGQSADTRSAELRRFRASGYVEGDSTTSD